MAKKRLIIFLFPARDLTICELQSFSVPSTTSADQLWYYNSLNDARMLLSFFSQPISNADFIVPVEIDGTVHQVLHTHNKKTF